MLFGVFYRLAVFVVPFFMALSLRVACI